MNSDTLRTLALVLLPVLFVGVNWGAQIVRVFRSAAANVSPRQTANVAIVTLWLLLAGGSLGWSLPSLPAIVTRKPPPIAVSRPAVLVVAEQTGTQSLLLHSLPFALHSAGVDWRILDDDFAADQLAKEAEWVRAAYALPRQSLPWIVTANQVTGYSGPLPATRDEIDALIREVTQ